MAYRETARVRARKQDQRDAILRAARRRIAEGGYQAARIQTLAVDAGVAAGTVYRYFGSKTELLAEVFRAAVQHEVDAVEAAARSAEAPVERLAAVVRTFIHRALQAPRLAYALLAEPLDPLVENERLLFRRAYAAIFEDVLGHGIAAGAFAVQDPRLSAAALVGLMNETLVGPLSPPADADRAAGAPMRDEPQLIEAVTALCLRAVAAAPDANARRRNTP